MKSEPVGRQADELDEVTARPTPARRSQRRTRSLDEAAAWLNRTTNDARLVEMVRRVRRALPGDPEFGDPLSTAGDGGPQVAARAADRLMGDRS